MPRQTTKQKFLVDYLRFYTEFLCSTAGSIRKLAKIQNKYPEVYKKLKDLQRNPDAILDVVDDLEEKEKLVLYELSIKSSSLYTRSKNLYELNSREQQQLAKDLDAFQNTLGKKEVHH